LASRPAPVIFVVIIKDSMYGIHIGHLCGFMYKI